MKKSLLWLSIFSCAMLGAAEFAVADSTVKLANSKSQIQQLAREELIKHLELAAGTKLNNSGKGFVFHLGTRPAGAPAAKTPTQAHYVIKGRDIYIYGFDFVHNNDKKDPFWFDARRTVCGTLSGVYNFLEKEMGVRWLFPDDNGIAVRRMDKLALPETKTHSWIMPLEMTVVRTYGRRPRFMMPAMPFTPEPLRMTLAEVDAKQNQLKLFARRMRHGYRSVLKYGHAFGSWWEKYGKDHPEYFGMDATGKRGLSHLYRGREKLCLSNPAVIEAIAKEYISAGRPRYYNICPNDGTPGFCRCPGCMALDARKPGEDFYATLTDRYVNFWNRLAARLRKERADVMLITYIYSYYRHPPRREKVQYPDNMLFGMVPTLFENSKKFFSDWMKSGAKNFFLRPNDLCHTSPLIRGMEKRIYDKFHQARIGNILGVDYDGSVGTPSLSLEIYVCCRMVHDPELSFDAIVDEYCSAFGAAAPEVKAYFAKWRENGERMIQLADKRLREQNRYLNDAGQITGFVVEDIEAYYPDSIFQETGKLLEKASARKLDAPAKKQLELLKLHHKHTLLTRDFFLHGNLKSRSRTNNLENIARELCNFRIRYNKELDWPWSLLFYGKRSEKNIWNQVNWYRTEILKLPPEDDSVAVNCQFNSNSALNDWSKREGFKGIGLIPDGTTALTLKPAKDRDDTYALTRANIRFIPGKRYQVTMRGVIPAKGKYIRLRVTGKGLKTNLYLRTKGDSTVTGEFTVPEKASRVRLYIAVSPGQECYLRSLVIKQVIVRQKDPNALIDHHFNEREKINSWHKRSGFAGMKLIPGTAITAAALKSGKGDEIALNKNIRIEKGKRYVVTVNGFVPAGANYIRLRLTQANADGKDINYYLRPAGDKREITFRKEFAAGTTAVINCYIIGGPGNGTFSYLNSLKIVPLDGSADALN